MNRNSDIVAFDGPLSISRLPSDCDYAFLDTGEILAAHLRLNFTGHIVGEIAFVRDKDGPYLIGGTRFSKPYVSDRKGYRSRLPPIRSGSAGRKFSRIMPSKSVVELAKVGHELQSGVMLDRALRGPASERLNSAIDWTIWALGIEDIGEISFGLTGSLGLVDSGCNSLSNIHDFDLVVFAEVNIISKLVKTCQLLTARHPELRVVEYEKSWRVRLQSPVGLVCLFFVALDGRFDTQDLASAFEVGPIEVRGLVSDARFGALCPSRYRVSSADGSTFEVVVPGLRYRGDLAEGDQVVIRGREFVASTDQKKRRIVVVDDETQNILINPPWSDYYV